MSEQDQHWLRATAPPAQRAAVSTDDAALSVRVRAAIRAPSPTTRQQIPSASVRRHVRERREEAEGHPQDPYPREPIRHHAERPQANGDGVEGERGALREANASTPSS